MNILKKRKAQQIVEFLLVAPFLVFFLLFLTEVTMNAQAKMAFDNALKYAIQDLYVNPAQEIGIIVNDDSIASNFENFVGYKVREYLYHTKIINIDNTNDSRNRLQFNPETNPNTGIKLVKLLNENKIVVIACAIYKPSITPKGLYRLVVGDDLAFTSYQIIDENIASPAYVYSSFEKNSISTENPLNNNDLNQEKIAFQFNNQEKYYNYRGEEMTDLSHIKTLIKYNTTETISTNLIKNKVICLSDGEQAIGNYENMINKANENIRYNNDYKTTFSNNITIIEPKD